jgi:hypothetical protein
MHGGAVRLRARFTRVSGPLVLLLFVLGLGGRAEAADDPREAALRAQLNTLDSLVRGLDGARSTARSYGDRVTDLHVRVRSLEARYGLRPGIVTDRSDVGTLLLEANELGRRVRAVLLAKAESVAPPRDVPDQGLFVPAPPSGAGAPPAPPPPTGPSAGKGIKWPASLTFNATSKLTYRPVGDWLLGPKTHSGWGPDFLQTGYAGAISFSIRARNLPREVRSADLRVVVRVLPPFAARGGYRVLDLTWKSERTLTNQALKTWMAEDRLTISGPYRWIKEPDDVTASLDVEAHVRSVTLHDGTVFHFSVPDFVRG